MQNKAHMIVIQIVAAGTIIAGTEPVLGQIGTQTTCRPASKCASCVGSLAGCGIAVSAPPPFSYLGVLSCLSGLDTCLSCYDQLQCNLQEDDDRAVDPVGMSSRAEGIVEGIRHGSRLTALRGNHIAIASTSNGLWGTGLSPISRFTRAPSPATPVSQQSASSSVAATLVARLEPRTSGSSATVGRLGAASLYALLAAKLRRRTPQPSTPAVELGRRVDTGDGPVATTRWFGRNRSRRSRPFRPGRANFRRDTRSLSARRQPLLSRLAAVLVTAACFSATPLGAQETSRPEVATQLLVTRSFVVAVAEVEGEVVPDTIQPMWEMRQPTFVVRVFHQRGDVIQPGDVILRLSTREIEREEKISAAALSMAEEIVTAYVEAETYAHRRREVHRSDEWTEESTTRQKQRSGGFEFSIGGILKSVASISHSAWSMGAMGVQETALGVSADAANTTAESTSARTSESSITEYDPQQSAQFELEARIAMAVAKFDAAGFELDLQDAIEAVARTRIFATSRSVVVSTLKPGDEVRAGTPVALVLDAAEVHIKLNLDPGTYDVVEYGDLCWVYYAADFGGRRPGLIDRKLGRSGRAGTVTCRVLDPPDIPDIDGRAVGEIEIAHRALAVPRAALIQGPTGETRIWTVTADGTVELREIVVGQGGRIYVEVLDGVGPQTEVVVVGGANLQDGDSVLTDRWLPREADSSSVAASSNIERTGR